ncbi:TetR family transcriptional regulator [Murinocardiopsis flavida]|uniref:TetR family transcriptional regulator n=1 Tax=Murinocardiopsis flavida TaxID=645275 RepID=A0A2P8DF98_9ACTN|nr:TetR/AcrR family transcriptional regulator [Murinocardiopsis flavida]PSK95877.1 TetR family transcriptional regulator [Murinocardiopsis flavida]
MVNDDATDPRILRSRERILAAAAELVAEHGIAGIGVEHIAKHSGVAKTTIYRHWPTLPELLIAALDRALPDAPSAPDTGDPARDVAGYLSALGASFDQRSAALVASLGAAARSDPAFAELNRAFVRQRREPLRALLAGAGYSGVDTLLAALGGAVFYWLIVTNEPVTREAVDELVRRVLPH